MIGEFGLALAATGEVQMERIEDMAHLVQQAKGKKYFDKFRGQIATFIEREEVLMKQRQEKAKG